MGGLYDFVVGTFGLWTESVSTRICEWGAVAADKFKVVFGLNTSAAVLGLGYIIGLKYAMIITAGSCLVWFVIVPVVGSLAEAVDPAAMLSLLGVTRADIVADPQSIFTAENLFAFIGKPIGIGGIAMAGIIGIIRQSKIIRQAVGLAVSEFGGGKSAAAAPERTQRDISMKRILTILIATLISVFVFFHFGLLDGWVQSVTAILIVFIIAFLFTTVAANAIAIVGTNPVSGMTLMTLILSSLVLVSVGLSGTTGMTAALVIGGVVCTALSMAGGFITDLKIGYWLGTTPRKQEAWKFLGTFVAAATVAGVMIILNKSYGFVGEGALVAPQANAMAAVIQPLMTGGQTPWMLYFCGAALALQREYEFQAAACMDKFMHKTDLRVTKMMLKGYEQDKAANAPQPKYRCLVWACPAHYYTNFTYWTQHCWGVTCVNDMEAMLSYLPITIGDREQALADLARCYEKMMMRSHTNGGYVNLLDECWKMCEKFHTNIVIMYDHVSCKNVGGLHGLFEDQARERGIHLIWIPHDVMDPRTVSRREMREAFSQYMVTVLNEKPLDPTLLDYEDALSW